MILLGFKIPVTGDVTAETWRENLVYKDNIIIEFWNLAYYKFNQWKQVLTLRFFIHYLYAFIDEGEWTLNKTFVFYLPHTAFMVKRISINTELMKSITVIEIPTNKLACSYNKKMLKVWRLLWTHNSFYPSFLYFLLLTSLILIIVNYFTSIYS